MGDAQRISCHGHFQKQDCSHGPELAAAVVYTAWVCGYWEGCLAVYQVIISDLKALEAQHLPERDGRREVAQNKKREDLFRNRDIY